MPTLERCLPVHFIRVVCLSEVSTLQGCLTEKSVCLTKVTPYSSACLTGVSALQGCLPYRGVCFTAVPTLRDMSALQGCSLYKGACLGEMAALERWLPCGGAHLTGEFTLERCLPYRGACLGKLSTLHPPNRGASLRKRRPTLQGFPPSCRNARLTGCQH